MLLLGKQSHLRGLTPAHPGRESDRLGNSVLTAARLGLGNICHDSAQEPRRDHGAIDGDGPCLRLQLPGQELHEKRFPSAAGAHDACQAVRSRSSSHVEDGVAEAKLPP
eukprot:2083562-Heterocapsa_arctica.AAC.1